VQNEWKTPEESGYLRKTAGNRQNRRGAASKIAPEKVLQKRLIERQKIDAKTALEAAGKIRL